MSSNDQKEWPKGVLAEDMPADFKPQPIPQPPEHLFGLLGNLPDINPNFMMESLWNLADIYGPVYYVNAVNRRFIVVSDYEYAHQVQDDDITEKFIVGVQNTVRELTGNGLLTAHQDDKEWHKAHRMLVPVFGPIGIRRMFPQMMDIASQLILKWDREGPEKEIDCSNDFIRLAFDTVGICAFNHRFNQFYKEAAHPFAGQMSEFLTESGRIANRSAIENALRRRSVKRLYDNIAAMTATIEEIVNERVKNPRPEVNDLLNVLLNATDTVTGEKLSEENVRFQMLTFLIAGHETTSATLSFMLYRFLKNPETLLKAQREVDEIVGDNPVELKHIPQLKYIYASMQETLRLTPPIGATTRRAKKDLVLSGKYKVDSNTGILINFHHLHQDTRIFGDDIHNFRPERFFERKIPTDAWRPFGVGMRGCVGRFFAEQEILLNIALILQRFQIEMADPSYELLLKVAGTIKPLDFKIRARRRPGKSLYVGLSQQGSDAKGQSQHKDGANGATDSKRGKLMIAYGSNAGTCKSLAEDMQSNAPEHGFDADLITLDQATEGLPDDVPVVIFASSYEGKPTDNAKKFVSWLELNSDKHDMLKNRHFAVFGVGNTEWASTYQKIPKIIEQSLKNQGAQQITDAFYSDIKYDTPGDYEKWADTVFAALKSSGQAGELEHRAEIKASVIKHDAPGSIGSEKDGLSWGVVKGVRSFGGLEVGPEKREVEIELPAGVRYSAGDYLSVQPANHPDNVERALAHFELHGDDLISIGGTRKSYLKTDGGAPVSARTLLSQRVELGQAATQRQIETLIAHDSDTKDQAALEALADPSRFQKDVTTQNYSVLDILEDHPSVKLPLATYLDMLRPMAARQYSIASSLLAQDYEATKTAPTKTLLSSNNNDEEDEGLDERRYTATITYDVHTAPARSGKGRTFHGVASSYLARLCAGDKVHCSVRRTNNSNFRLPEDPSVPAIFIAAGTGIAPMRGFIQERAALISARSPGGGKPDAASAAAAGFAPAILYFGCRDYEKDNLYADELAAWQASGAVEVRYAFSRRGPPAAAENGGQEGGFKYVHERIYAEREEVANLFSQKGAKIFLCGSAGKLAKSCADTLMKIYMERSGKTEEEAKVWLDGVKETRYVTDVFD